MIRSAVEHLGGRTVHAVSELGRITRFAGWIGAGMLRPPYRPYRVVRETYDSGVLSLAIVCASGLAVGLVMGLQLYHVLVRFGAEESLGAVVGLSLIRELGPVLTGLLVAGRAGSAMAAEIGMMVATEQIDGMRTMAVDPIKFVIVPKAIALTLSMPLLNALFVVFSIFGAYLVGVEMLGLSPGIYLAGLESAVIFETDIVGSLLKALLFGALVALIATFRGFTTGRSTAQVSASTTSTVVMSSVSILLADYVFTALWGF